MRSAAGVSSIMWNYSLFSGDDGCCGRCSSCDHEANRCRVDSVAAGEHAAHH